MAGVEGHRHVRRAEDADVEFEHFTNSYSGTSLAFTNFEMRLRWSYFSTVKQEGYGRIEEGVSKKRALRDHY